MLKKPSLKQSILCLLLLVPGIIVSGPYAEAHSGVRFTPLPVPLTAREIDNPLRGQYIWLADPSDPAGWPVKDSYDRYNWRTLEPSRGVYDFSAIDRALAMAKARGGRYGFRVMPVCTGCGVGLPDYIAGDPSSWTVRANGADVVVPDWNSDFYLSRWTALNKALGDRYGNDPRLGFVDIGGYGNWGEWHNWPYTSAYPGPLGQSQVTLDGAKAIINAVVDHFPSKLVLAQPGDSRFDASHSGDPVRDVNSYILQYALGKSLRVGLRDDCLGGDVVMQNAQKALLAAQILGPIDPLDRWKTAPFVTEWCGNIVPGAKATFTGGDQQVSQYHVSMLSSGNYHQPWNDFDASQQAAFIHANKVAGYRYVLNSVTLSGTITRNSSFSVTSSWRNANVAPTYDAWRVKYQLRDPLSHAVVFEALSGLDLKKVLPATTATIVADTFNVGPLARGEYDLVVSVVDPGGNLAPMNLAIQGRLDDGSYELGRLRVR
jgi:hypothetical protein